MSSSMLWLGGAIILILVLAGVVRMLLSASRAEKLRQEQIKMHKTGIYRQPWSSDPSETRGSNR